MFQLSLAQEYEEPLEDFEVFNEREEEVGEIDEESLVEWVAEPVDINSCTKEEMMKIPGMNDHLAEEILRRRTIKPYKHLTELRTLNGITPDLYGIFLRWFSVVKNKHQNVKLQNRLERDLQLSQGFHNGVFLGSPNYLQTRMKTHHTIDRGIQSIQSAVSIEKEPGERMQDAFVRGYIHTAFSPQMTVTVGNYVIHAGEGLVVGYPSMISRSVSYTALRMFSQTRVSPYASSSPGWIFRGFAYQWHEAQSLLSIFYSSQNYSGTLDEQMNFVSFDYTGYTRTVTELKKLNVLRERAVGGVMMYTIENIITVGTVAYSARYNRPLALPTMIDTTKSLFQYSGFMRIRLPHMLVGAEYAWDTRRRRAFSGRMLLQLSDEWNCILGLRRYPEHFMSMHGSSTLATGTLLCNEEGFSIGIQGNVLDNMNVSLFHDSYLQRDRTTCEQLQGTIEQYDCSYRLSKRFDILLRFKQKNYVVQHKLVDPYSRVENAYCKGKVQKYQIQGKYTPTPKCAISNKLTVIRTTEQENEHGVSIQQILSYQPVEYFRLETSATIFETKSYNSRITAYEPNLPGYSTFTALYGEGIRWYVIVVLRPLRTITCSCKFLQLAKDGNQSYGSGNDTIRGSVRSRILFQLDFTM